MVTAVIIIGRTVQRGHVLVITVSVSCISGCNIRAVGVLPISGGNIRCNCIKEAVLINKSLMCMLNSTIDVNLNGLMVTVAKLMKGCPILALWIRIRNIYFD